MAAFTIEIKDEDILRVIEAVCENYGYSEEVLNPDFVVTEGGDIPEFLPNPENSMQFANRMVRKFLMDNTVAYEKRKAEQAISTPTPPEISDPLV
jgi:hypothetical protein